jgi:glutaredoxin
LDTQVLGISIDHVPCLKAWADSLGGINYPLLSDFWPHGVVSNLYGVLRGAEGRSERAVFVIDKQGVIRYIDVHDIDDQPDNEDLFRALERLEPEAAARWAALPKPEQAPLPHGGIVMYCTSWCVDCKKARLWLKNHGLDFTEVDINRVPGAPDFVRRCAGGRLITPTFDIDGKIVVDFDPHRLREVLGL